MTFPSRESATASVVEPGQTCESCGRRVPHPKKVSTPDTRPVSYRVPNDEVQAHREVLESAAKHLGVHEKPYWQFQVYTLALAHLLQDETVKGYANAD